MHNIISELNYKETMLNEVEPFLAGIRKQGSFSSFDGNKISYEAYGNSDSKAAVLVLHGFTESAEKFREVAYYFYSEGYSVYSLDLRGHGNSFRTSKKTGTVNAESFDDYAEDINAFVETVIRPCCADKPLYIFSHSLGSTAAILYMESHPDVVSRAVLSSPMICGNMGMPVPVAAMVAKLLCAVGGNNISAPGRCKFNPELKFDDSDATSEARFEYYQEKRKNNILLQTSGPSFGWVNASIRARDKLLSDAHKIKPPLLILRPEEDKQLLSEYQDKFIAEVTDVKVVGIKGSKHEIFGSTDKVLEEYYRAIFGFLTS